jgi:hypothetical protein
MLFVTPRQCRKLVTIESGARMPNWTNPNRHRFITMPKQEARTTRLRPACLAANRA